MNDHAAVAELARKAEQDASLREALQNVQTTEEIVQAAAQAGITVSPGELRAWGRQHLNGSELSDMELATVAGGFGMPGDDLVKFIRKLF